MSKEPESHNEPEYLDGKEQRIDQMVWGSKSLAHVVSKAARQSLQNLNQVIVRTLHTAFRTISSKTKLCIVWFASKKNFSKG